MSRDLSAEKYRCTGGLTLSPLSLETAWQNVEKLIALPGVLLILENSGFAGTFQSVTRSLNIRGKLVPDAHIASWLQQDGGTRIYKADSDHPKFGFLEVINPFA